MIRKYFSPSHLRDAVSAQSIRRSMYGVESESLSDVTGGKQEGERTMDWVSTRDLVGDTVRIRMLLA